MLKVIIIRGPLGVGKTTVAEQVAKTINAQYFSIDKILAEHKLDQGDGIPVENFLKINSLLTPQIEDVLAKEQSVVIDGNFYYKEALDDLNDKLSIEPTVFTLTASVETCIARDIERGETHGADATRAVFNMVSQVKAGQEINTENTNIEQIVKTILSS